MLLRYDDVASIEHTVHPDSILCTQHQHVMISDKVCLPFAQQRGMQNNQQMTVTSCSCPAITSWIGLTPSLAGPLAGPREASFLSVKLPARAVPAHIVRHVCASYNIATGLSHANIFTTQSAQLRADLQFAVCRGSDGSYHPAEQQQAVQPVWCRAGQSRLELSASDLPPCPAGASAALRLTCISIALPTCAIYKHRGNGVHGNSKHSTDC